MKIAATYDNGNIFQHFGRSEAFKFYDVDGGAVTATAVRATEAVIDPRRVVVAADRSLDSRVEGVAQCRDRGGRCEGRDLDLGQPRERQRIHQRDFVFRGNELLLHLQAIARPDLAHANARVGTIPNRCCGTH